jgi:hypothetical protein
MPVVINEGTYGAWLTVRMEKAKEFMRQYAPQWLAANPLETKADKVPKGLLGCSRAQAGRGFNQPRHRSANRGDLAA